MTQAPELKDLMGQAEAQAGASAPAVADLILKRAFPVTAESADHEGCASMLRRGLADRVRRYLRSPRYVEDVDWRRWTPGWARRLKSHAYYVPSLRTYVSLNSLLLYPHWLNEAQQHLRLKANQTMAEARTLLLLHETIVHGDDETPAEEAAA